MNIISKALVVLWALLLVSVILWAWFDVSLWAPTEGNHGRSTVLVIVHAFGLMVLLPIAGLLNDLLPKSK